MSGVTRVIQMFIYLSPVAQNINKAQMTRKYFLKANHCWVLILKAYVD